MAVGQNGKGKDCQGERPKARNELTFICNGLCETYLYMCVTGYL